MTAFRGAFVREVDRLLGDRWHLALLFVLPALLLGLMAAMLVGGTPRNLPVAVVGTSEAVQVAAQRIDASPAVQVVTRVTTEAEALSLMREGRILAFAELPRRDGDPARISYNAAYLSSGGLAQSALSASLSDLALERGLDRGGISGLALARLGPPPVSVTILANPGASFEWYLQALVDPAVLHLLIACASAMAMGRELSGRSLGDWARGSGGTAGALAGKLLPYVVIATGWGAVWMIWIAGIRGWVPSGSLWLVLAGQALLYAATAAISALLVALTRETSTALAASAVYAGSALAYSGGSLPVEGGSLFARGWSALLPFTHYLDLQMDQWIGASPGVALGQIMILALYAAIPFVVTLVLLRRERAS